MAREKSALTLTEIVKLARTAEWRKSKQTKWDDSYALGIFIYEARINDILIETYFWRTHDPGNGCMAGVYSTNIGVKVKRGRLKIAEYSGSRDKLSYKELGEEDRKRIPRIYQIAGEYVERREKLRKTKEEQKTKKRLDRDAREREKERRQIAKKVKKKLNN